MLAIEFSGITAASVTTLLATIIELTVDTGA
jgi:hypothetical protein